MSKARSRARRLAMQALYEWQVADNTPREILRTYQEEHDLGRADQEYFSELLLATAKNHEQIDKQMEQYLSRPLHEIDPVELAILRLAGYELMFRPDVPYRVVINEAIELAKKFGAEAGHRFINGILDKFAQAARTQEIKLKQRP